MYIDIVHAQNHIPDHYSDYLQDYRAVRLLKNDGTILKDFSEDGNGVMYGQVLKF